ncbi:MAG: hypothetical protein GXO02_06380, partial [Epsilonproteobacteria bacterium]|nr:hypothetical protein [Campylobacterota bacterium]
MIFVIFILIIRFALFYVEYIDFKKKEIYYKNLFVQKFFRLNNKNIVRAKDKKGRVFYIILNKNYYLKSDDLVRVRIYPKESSFYFLDYLHYLYIKGEIIGKISYSSLKANLKKKIFNIHKNRDIAQFYSAIFLAYPIFSSLREKLSALGISHLIAISGFHLGIIYFVIFLLFGLIYSFFHKRLFPFRDKQRDIGIIAIGIV